MDAPTHNKILKYKIQGVKHHRYKKRSSSEVNRGLVYTKIWFAAICSIKPDIKISLTVASVAVYEVLMGIFVLPMYIISRNYSNESCINK